MILVHSTYPSDLLSYQATATGLSIDHVCSEKSSDAETWTLSCAGEQSPYNASQGPRRQAPGPMGRQVPAQYQRDPEDGEDVSTGSPRRSRGLGSASRRRSSPGSSPLEQPNFPSRMRGPGSKSHGPSATPQAFDDGEADAQQDGELEIIPASMLERQEQNVQGVPASWRETIQDQEVGHVMQAVASGICCFFRLVSKLQHTLPQIH